MAEGEKQKKRKRPVFQKKIKKSTIVDQTISKLQEEYTRVSFSFHLFFLLQFNRTLVFILD